MRTPNGINLTIEKLLVIAGFLLVIVAPGALYLLGIGPAPLVNEDLQPPPDLAVGRILEPEMFGEIAGWYEDRVPIRPPAVRSDAWVDLHVFEDSPDPRVLLGRDGWLFFRPSYALACAPAADGERAASSLSDTARLLSELGRPTVVLIAPDKASIYPEMAPREAHEICDRAESETLRSAVEQTVAAAVPSWSILTEQRDGFSLPIYEPGDTHWTSPASTLMVGEVVRRFDSSLWSDDDIIIDMDAPSITADLTDLIGLPQPALPRRYQVARAGAVTTSKPSADGRGILFSTTGTDVIEGSTLVIYDSFGRRLIDDLPKYFAQTTWLDWRSFEREDDAARILAEALLAHDRVIIEIVERETYRRAGILLADATLSVIESAVTTLEGRPVDRWTLLGTDPDDPVILGPPDPVALSIPPGSGTRYLVLRVFEAGEPIVQISDHPVRRPTGEYVALPVGNGTEVTLVVRGGRLQVRSAQLVSLPGS